jgi:hypothetical protein
VESTHHVVTALGAIRTEGLPVALAEPAMHAAISVMATVAIAPSLRTAPIIMLASLRMPTNGPSVVCQSAPPSTAQPSTALTKSSVFDDW